MKYKQDEFAIYVWLDFKFEVLNNIAMYPDRWLRKPRILSSQANFVFRIATVKSKIFRELFL